MSKRAWTIVMLCLWTAAAAGRLQPGQAAGKAPIALTYIANMGVLVGSGDTKVLVDALFDKPNTEYRAPAPETLDKIMKGEAPFDGVDLVLVTHNHPDHFAAGVAVSFLESRPETVLVVPADAVAEMRKAASDWTKLEPRVIFLDLENGDVRRLTAAGIPITAIRTLHSGGGESPMNVMYLFEIGGRRVFHEGDSTGKPEVFMGFGLESAPVDLAVLHFWFPLEPNMAKYLQEVFQPDHIALGHLPIRLEGDAPGKIDMVRQYYKDLALLLPGMPPIIMPRAALSAGMDRITSLLIKEKNVDYGNVDGLGNTLLYAAARSGETTFLGLLIDKGVDPNAGNIYGWTPLHVAASLGHQKIIEALLRNGADKRIRTKDGKTPSTSSGSISARSWKN